MRATIIPWGHPSMQQPSRGEACGKPPSLVALLPAAAGVRRARVTPPDRHDEVVAEASRPLHDDNGGAAS